LSDANIQIIFIVATTPPLIKLQLLQDFYPSVCPPVLSVNVLSSERNTSDTAYDLVPSGIFVPFVHIQTDSLDEERLLYVFANNVRTNRHSEHPCTTTKAQSQGTEGNLGKSLTLHLNLAITFIQVSLNISVSHSGKNTRVTIDVQRLYSNERFKRLTGPVKPKGFKPGTNTADLASRQFGSQGSQENDSGRN